MVEWHPAFSARGDGTARSLARRGLQFLFVGVVTVVAAFGISQAGLDRWHRSEAERADTAHYSALGLRHVCSGVITVECLDRTARAAGVAIVSVSHGIADTAVPIGVPQAKAVAKFAPDPARAMYGHFNAVQYAGVQVSDGSLLGVDLYSKPTTQPAYPYRAVRTVDVDGVAVRVRTAPAYACAALEPHAAKPYHCPENVWAVWQHDGQLYAANFTSYRAMGGRTFLRSPVETLQMLFPELSYSKPI